MAAAVTYFSLVADPPTHNSSHLSWNMGVDRRRLLNMITVLCFALFENRAVSPRQVFSQSSHRLFLARLFPGMSHANAARPCDR